MIFSLILILLVGVVAFFHYIQGFMSATVSAICAAFAVLIAFSYYEPVVVMMSPGKFADTAHGMMLVVLFAFVYLVLRILFDKFIPGNVRVPAIVDKVGGGIMGLIAGILSVGLLAVVAQSLPFGPSIAGYARYRVKPDPQKLVVPVGGNQSRDRTVYDELAVYNLNDETPTEGLILPVDDFVVGFVSHVSQGAASGSQPFTRIHPDYLRELFGNRIGIEQGGKHSAQPIAKTDVVELLGLFTVDSVQQVDAEIDAIRRRGADDKLEKTLKPGDGERLLIVRLQFKSDAADDDRLVRVSTGAVRLVGKIGEGVYRQYHPVGTVEAGRLLMVNKPDDFLFVPGDKAADFLFKVDAAAMPEITGAPGQISGSSEMFVEAKRYGRVPLAGKAVEKLAASDRVQVLRKTLVVTAAENADPETAKKKIVGAWDTSENGVPVVFTFSDNGTWKADLTANNQPVQVTGTWKVVTAPPPGITIESSTKSGSPKRFRFEFANPDNATVTDVASKATFSYTRKK